MGRLYESVDSDDPELQDAVDITGNPFCGCSDCDRRASWTFLIHRFPHPPLRGSIRSGHPHIRTRRRRLTVDRFAVALLLLLLLGASAAVRRTLRDLYPPRCRCGNVRISRRGNHLDTGWTRHGAVLCQPLREVVDR